jgi:ATP-dependent RNA helicase DDX27
MALEDDKELGQTGVVNAAIRSAKKAARPAKIGIPVHRSVSTSKRTKARKGTSKAGGAFDRDLSSKAARSEGVRAKKGDAIGGMGKHKGGKRRGK